MVFLSPAVLRGTSPVARGGAHLVYKHPLHEDLLIKIVRPETIEKRWQFKRTWLGRFWFKRRYGIYTAAYRELREYLSVRAHLPDHPRCLQRPIGFIETDLGLGFVVEKIFGRDGDLAPTLGSVVGEQGFTPALRNQFAELEREIDRIDIATGDLNLGGILCAYSPDHGDHMVIVDGLGDKTFLRVNTWSRLIRSWTNRRHFRRIEERCLRVGLRRRRSGGE